MSYNGIALVFVISAQITNIKHLLPARHYSDGSELETEENFLGISVPSLYLSFFIKFLNLLGSEKCNSARRKLAQVYQRNCI